MPLILQFKALFALWFKSISILYITIYILYINISILFWVFCIDLINPQTTTNLQIFAFTIISFSAFRFRNTKFFKISQSSKNQFVLQYCSALHCNWRFAKKPHCSATYKFFHQDMHSSYRPLQAKLLLDICNMHH